MSGKIAASPSPLASARLALLGVTLLAACSVETAGREERAATAQSCMLCHNGSPHDDYAGPGLENPHPFGAANNLQCTVCHGGDGAGSGVLDSHVPPPPEIGDRQQWEEDRFAYFNRLTLTGLDKLPDYTVDGVTYTALDYLQFINPGDLRVVQQGRSCGMCHADVAASVTNSLLATEAGIISGAMYAVGVENAIPANRGLYADTAADLAFRAVQDVAFAFDPAVVGPVASLLELPVKSVHGEEGAGLLYRNDTEFRSVDLPADLNPDNTVKAGSALETLYREQVAFTCGDCHLGSAGANNRYGDFRSSGCTACHMRYSLDGRSRSGDPNVPKTEPQDPDDIRAPERAHVRSHRIQSIAQTLSTGEQATGIDDYTCAGCHQGSNRTVMQYWGIRLDQNQDLRRGVQYPASPDDWENTRHDERLFDPVVDNNTFNGRNANQYILFEDYDGDERDDTPPDVHYDAGMGCIDCHGAFEMHGGNTSTGDPQVLSRMEHGVAITCESCHGGVDAPAPTATGVAYDGTTKELAVDSKGNLLRHVEKDGDGHYWMTSRLTGATHYVKQTVDTIVENGRTHPTSGLPLYSAKASFAMGRADGDPLTGLGPVQTGGNSGYSHSDDVTCVACHASWTNNCVGCHLGGEYDTNPNNFSNITGERIVFRQANADFVYQTPVLFQLGIDEHDKVAVIAPNTDVFFQYEDRGNVDSDIFAFTDRNGGGNNPAVASNPALAHNVMMPHSIRGKVETYKEGPRYCVSCHLTDEAIANWGAEYDTFRTALATDDFASLDFGLLQTEIGRNPGNQRNSPFFVHMAAGLGSGLFLFDQYGCPVNPLDTDANRIGCDGDAPITTFDLARVRYNLDRIVDENGVSMGSSSHAVMDQAAGATQRVGATDGALSGPLGRTTIERLTDPDTGIVLDAWLDANGDKQGDAPTLVPDP